MENKQEYYIRAVYNTPDYEESDAHNMWQNIIVRQPTAYGKIYLDIYEKSMEINENGEKEYSDISFYSITIDNDEPVWDLCFENMDRCYAAFHAYAVGCDGSHLSYMIVELVDKKECLELVS